MSRFPTIFKLNDRLSDLFDPWCVLVIELVEFGQSMLDLSIAGGALFSTTQCDRSLQLDLRHPLRFTQHDDDVQSPEALALRADGGFETHSRKECPGVPGESP
ncbi:hypothetical protein [Burkholderia pseudomultivorans]|uniref:hypothetical protein n=1 Tax=Burkholderia pseudomultivorans TaxID=1207504 RepID=UPI00158CBAC2|nr:hypothetical protein [Burkholderia pseudomultivorans]